jgi:hypothetical protein
LIEQELMELDETVYGHLDPAEDGLTFSKEHLIDIFREVWEYSVFDAEYAPLPADRP